MPPKVRITKEEILQAAVAFVRENGAQALNARAIATALDCSTQPLFSNFATMEELKTATVAAAYELYLNFINREAESRKYPQYKAFGMAYVRFAMEEKELFDSTPAERMEAYLDEYRTLLASAEEGWLLQYFPEETQAYGGYTYILEFTRDSVAAYFELADKIEEPVASLYKMTPDDGPVITFDTYNENIHFFATPNISDYEAMHGDYEFRIVGKNDDETEIYMRGKRTNNNYTLVKFSGDPVEYLGKINEVNAAMEAPAYRMVMDSDTTVCSIKGNVFEFEYNVYTEFILIPLKQK